MIVLTCLVQKRQEKLGWPYQGAFIRNVTTIKTVPAMHAKVTIPATMIAATAILLPVVPLGVPSLMPHLSNAFRASAVYHGFGLLALQVGTLNALLAGTHCWDHREREGDRHAR